jgi:hypothetical protein
MFVMSYSIEEVVVLEPLNTKDYKVIDKKTLKQIGFMLRKAKTEEGFDLHPNFRIPENIDFPDSAKTLLEGWAIFNRIYRKLQ